MIIVYLHQYFNSPEMAGGTRSYEMARRLVAKGHQVHMVTSLRDNDAHEAVWRKTTESGIHVHWLPVPYSNRMSYFERIKAFFRFAMAAGRKAATLNPDIVFATSTPLTIAIPAVRAAKVTRVPMVFEVRDLWPELPIAIGALSNPLTKWAARLLERWAYRHSEAVVALSPGMKSGVVKAGYPAERVAVIPNSSDNADFRLNAGAAQQFRQNRSWLGDRPLILYAGTFGKINGVGYLVDLAAELWKLDPEVRILLIGDGMEYEAVVQKALEKDVLGRNLFVEKSIPKNQVISAFSAATLSCSLFVDLPEMEANSANKFFDALAASTPVIINYGGWQEDLIRSSGCGLALKGRTLPEAAELIIKRINDGGWLEASGAAARELAETYFDRDKLAADLEVVLLSAVKGNGVDAHKMGFRATDDLVHVGDTR